MQGGKQRRSQGLVWSDLMVVRRSLALVVILQAREGWRLPSNAWQARSGHHDTHQNLAIAKEALL